LANHIPTLALTNRFIGSELERSLSAAEKQLPLWKYLIDSINEYTIFIELLQGKTSIHGIIKLVSSALLP
jgi:hypothetical protein